MSVVGGREAAEESWESFTAAEAILAEAQAGGAFSARSGRERVGVLVKAGRALRVVREEKLWKGRGMVDPADGVLTEWSSFDDYCRGRWGVRRETGDRLIRDADVLDVLVGVVSTEVGDPEGFVLGEVGSESVLRELAGLLGKPTELVSAFTAARSGAVVDGVRITAARVRTAVDGFVVRKRGRAAVAAAVTPAVVDAATAGTDLVAGGGGGLDGLRFGVDAVLVALGTLRGRLAAGTAGGGVRDELVGMDGAGVGGDLIRKSGVLSGSGRMNEVLVSLTGGMGLGNALDEALSRAVWSIADLGEVLDALPRAGGSVGVMDPESAAAGSEEEDDDADLGLPEPELLT